MNINNVYFRIFFVVLAVSGTVILMQFYPSVSLITPLSRKSEYVSATRNNSGEPKTDYSGRNRTTDAHENKTYVKPIALNSPFIDPKLHIDEITDYMTIMWWNVPGWLLPWQQNTDMKQCKYKNCKVSFDKKDFNKSHAVVFSIADRGMGYTPPVPMSKRNPDQAWLFFTLESPVHAKRSNRGFLSPHWNNAFNWSWNYRTDSDIFSPYGWLRTKEILPVRNYSEVFRKKTKQVAWLVSHCRSVSGRDEYARQLNKYIPVDIFGRCGQKAPDNIFEFINKNYKFYLGFENSLCLDYVTEKFFQYYQYDVITVLRGKTKYSDHLPANSYIDTANFSSIEALGKFLKELSENEEEFTKYMKIKDMYDVQERNIVYRDAVCNVCDKLNNLDKNRKVYKNVGAWVGTCDKPKDV